MGRRAGLGIAACAALVAAAAAPAARAQQPALTPDEQAELAFESSIIGREHALQHLQAHRTDAQPRQVQQPGEQASTVSAAPFDPCLKRGPATQYESRPLPPKDQPTGQARCSTLPPQPTGAALRRDGRWTKAVQDLPHYAIHAALLPSGKVLFWGFEWTQRLITKNPASHQDTSSSATLWNPRSGRFKPVPSPMADVDGDGVPEHIPLYCAGQSFLPDGRVLVTGGTLDLLWAQKGYTNPPGLPITLTFDPRSETWSRGPDMGVARWYPTNVELSDGRTLVLGGFDDGKPTNLTGRLESISADGRTVTHHAQGDRVTWTYPGLALLPSDRILLAGPRPEDTGLLDPKTMTWSKIAPFPEIRGGEAVVPVPTRTGSSPRVMVLGGADFLGPSEHRDPEPDAYRTTRVFDDRAPGKGWRSAPAQRRPRNWPNAVLLPDGSMVTVGGGTKIGIQDGAYASEPANRRVELWDPSTKRWRLGPAQREDRTYHSIALLLPDGRVWSAGDDANPNRDGDTGEIYAPGYLFRGPRPKLSAVPTRVAPKRRFTITASGPRVDRVTLVAPSAVTHALNMNQRFVELKVVRRDGRRMTVEGPKDTVVAPPGPYMLFALTKDGVPSVARWTSVR